MPDPICPICGATVETPQADHQSLEGSADCPECGRPLTWFFDERSDGKWIIDEGAEGRRRMHEGPGGYLKRKA